MDVDIIVPLTEEVNIEMENNTFKHRVRNEFRPKFCQICQEFGHACPPMRNIIKWVPKKVILTTPPPTPVPFVVTIDVTKVTRQQRFASRIIINSTRVLRS